MYQLDNGTRVVEPCDELPDLCNALRLYLDFETTSLDTTRDSLNPWIKQHCKILGIAITADDMPGAWYIPLRHRVYAVPDWPNDNTPNYSHERAGAWLRGVLATCGTWVNHNVKYDAHVAYNDDVAAFDVLSSPMRLVDTLTRAKIVNSDMGYNGGYGLDNLSAKWLYSDIEQYQIPIKAALAQKFERKNNRDYGLVGIRDMAAYAGQDVLTNRHLDRYLAAAMPTESRDVCETETRLTKILVDIERTGLTVDPIEIKKAALYSNAKALALQSEICRLTGYDDFKPHVNSNCLNLLVNYYGLPVIAYTNDVDPEELHLLEPGETPGNPSFSKATLKQYLDLLEVRENSELFSVVSKIIEFRHYNTKLNIFLNPYMAILAQTGESVIHSTYNQCVRTGRMSCADPNAMQLDEATKELIRAAAGCGIISTDASQIEFRTIVHYIADKRCIDTYNADPDTDFHDKIAEWADMSRKPAKTVNFMAGYGGGKKKTVKLLSASVEVAHKIRAELGDLPPEQFKAELVRRAEKLYERYHDSLPTLKPRSKEAERICRNRGYVQNWYGRQRRLPSEFAHIAFNTVNQSTAADIVKERMVALYDAIAAAQLPIKILAQVHDELVLQTPAELATDEGLRRDIVRLLEQPTRPLSVPIRWSIGYSVNNWAEAGRKVKDGGTSTTLPDVHTTQPVYF